MSTITITDVRASESRLESTITVPASLRRFFAERTFRATYDCDLADVDESVLAIPVVGHVAPVAWANGADVAVPALDRDFRNCLTTVRESLRAMYPEFMTGGEVRVDRPVKHDGPTDGGSGLLFSGGVDSLASFARNRDDVTTLIGVQGWTVEDDGEWDKMEARTRSMADRHGVDTSFVRSNALSMLDTPMLGAHYKRYLVGSWYSGVGHGLGLLSLCAPLSVAEGLDHVYIASTHTEEFDHPWGSHPSIDDHVRWGTASAEHDGFELGRQEKIYRIAEFIENADPDLTLYTCNEGEATNCNDCEKCYRTAVGLLLAGLDPTDHGYDIEPADLETARERVESGEWLIDENFLFMWQDLQSHAEAGFEHESPAARAFFEWLADVDLEACFERGPTAREDPRGRFLRTVARNTPYPVYASIYPIYDQLRNARS